jgi:hypothetical protein
MDEAERNEFTKELAEKKMNFNLPVFVTYYTDENEMKSPTLAQLLGFGESHLTVSGSKALRFLEFEKRSDSVFSFDAFKWKLHAFLSLQDLVFPPVFEDAPWKVIFQMKYFYYESKYILTESILSSLNGLHIGNNHLLRLFIEFNLLQLYFINKTKKESSYQGINEYFKTGIKPSNTGLLKLALPDDQFCKPIKKRIQVELEQLSTRFSHAYIPDHSPKAISVAIPHTSVDSIYFYVQVLTVLDTVLWMYYVNLPMLFFPVYVTRKFGFSPPTGVYATPSIGAIVKKSITQTDYAIFKEYAQKNEDVKGHLDWYESHPDLTDEQIWETADERREPDDTILTYFVKQTAEFRAKSEMVVEQIRKRLADDNIVNNNFEVEKLGQCLSFNQWRTIYHKL